MRVGHTEVCCQSSTMIIALVAGSIDPCHPVLSFPRKNNTRRDDEKTRCDGLLPEHVPVARWAGGCLRARHEEDWRVIVPPVILRSRARRGTLPRALPSLRDPHATRSGRASVRGSSGSRTARLESVRRFDKLEADCASRRRRGSPRRTSRDMLPSMVRRYAAARRKQTRSQRLQAR